MILIIIMEVIGKKNLKFDFSTRISPGNFPRNDKMEVYLINNPIKIIKTPKIIRIVEISFIIKRRKEQGERCKLK